MKNCVFMISIIQIFIKIGQQTNVLEYMILGHTSCYEKWCLHNFDILEKCLKDWALNKKYIAEKDHFEILR